MAAGVTGRVARGGPVVRGALIVVALVLGSAGCASSGRVPVVTFPATTFGPSLPPTGAVAATRAAIAAALGQRQIVLNDTTAPFRPAEAAAVAAAPRAVFQAWLAQDPDRGMIVIYEFPDSAAATAAATDQQRFLESGFGRVQTAQGTVHVIRTLGNTLIVYDWLPGAALDPKAPEVEAALETIGVGYPVD